MTGDCITGFRWCRQSAFPFKWLTLAGPGTTLVVTPQISPAARVYSWRAFYSDTIAVTTCDAYAGLRPVIPLPPTT